MTKRIEIEYELKAEEDDDIQDYKKPWVDLTTEEIDEFEKWLDFKEEGSGWVAPAKIVAYISNKLRSKNT
jgi:hypothetical protein